MAKFRKRPVIIDVTQWFENSDHPQDNCHEIKGSNGKPFLSEGKVVRRYRNPDDDDKRRCELCTCLMHNHGWIDTIEGGHTVCPGDWIITGIIGEMYPCKPDIFKQTYEPVD